MTISKYIIIGFMGAGKTYFAQKLNYLLHIPYIDIDHEIVKREQHSISQIFNDKGEMYFRETETEVLKNTLSKNNLIISTGGGIIESDQNRSLIKNSHSEVIFLNPDWELIWHRIKESGRPIVKNSTETEVYNLWQKRQLLYKECATIHLDSFDIINESLYEISNSRNLSLFLNLKEHK